MLNAITKIRRARWIFLGRRKIKKQISALPSAEKLKINLGSGNMELQGWIATDLPHFDILKKEDWHYYFKKKRPDNLLAEHVIEHLTEPEVRLLFQHVLQFLKPKGCFRIAVPDGFNPDPYYIDYVSPNGKTGYLHGHKTLWNYQSLMALASENFEVALLEYHDNNGKYILTPYTDANGWIHRSGKRSQNPLGKSLVVDLIKR